jgi:hypothetical protein
MLAAGRLSFRGSAQLASLSVLHDGLVLPRIANPHLRGLHMRNALALMTAAVVAAIAAPAAQAGERVPVLPVIPYEFGIASPGRVGWFEYRCTGEPVYNFYHGAYYPQVPAVHDGFTYRHYYRYTADRKSPKTFLCAVVE